MEFNETGDEYEIGRGEVIGPAMTVNVVLRYYTMPPTAFMSHEPPIKFIPVNDLDGEFHVAVYVPTILFHILDWEAYQLTLESLVSLAGVTFHNDGPDALSRLG